MNNDAQKFDTGLINFALMKLYSSNIDLIPLNGAVYLLFLNFNLSCLFLYFILIQKITK